ncbi:MAG: 30S ribosomal protein S9 [bacterium]|nr:30S ribosomal protein S9 [bacterium]
MSITPTPIQDLPLQSVGRRKAATARVRITKNGSGTMTVNGKPYTEYFTTIAARAVCTQALEAVGQSDKLDISVLVRGGGLRGQADATRLGIARGLQKLNPTFHRALRKVGFLTRDARIKERKKPGLKKARRAPQWSKR